MNTRDTPKGLSDPRAASGMRRICGIRASTGRRLHVSLDLLAELGIAARRLDGITPA